MRSYTFRVFMNVISQDVHAAPLDRVSHVELGTYDNLEHPPWVPPVGSYFRFRDAQPPGKDIDHNEKKGYVASVVTCFYGTSTVIEIYLQDKRPPQEA